MKRINEALAFQAVLAPKSVAAATDQMSAYVDLSEVEEVAFLISTAALGAGKSLTVKLLTASDGTGSDAEEIGTAKFTDAVGTEAQTAVVTYRPNALHGRYAAVKLQHDGAAAVVCGVTAAVKGLWLPAGNGWTLVV